MRGTSRIMTKLVVWLNDSVGTVACVAGSLGLKWNFTRSLRLFVLIEADIPRGHKRKTQQRIRFRISSPAIPRPEEERILSRSLLEVHSSHSLINTPEAREVELATMFDNFDWATTLRGMILPLAYVGVLLGSLITFSSLYRKRKAGQ